MRWIFNNVSGEPVTLINKTTVTTRNASLNDAILSSLNLLRMQEKKTLKIALKIAQLGCVHVHVMVSYNEYYCHYYQVCLRIITFLTEDKVLDETVKEFLESRAVVGPIDNVAPVLGVHLSLST